MYVPDIFRSIRDGYAENRIFVPSRDIAGILIFRSVIIKRMTFLKLDQFKCIQIYLSKI